MSLVGSRSPGATAVTSGASEGLRFALLDGDDDREPLSDTLAVSFSELFTVIGHRTSSDLAILGRLRRRGISCV